MASSMEARFEEKAGKIHDYLKTKLRYGDAIPPPFMIEFTGSPSAGKTTTIIELDKFLRRHDFRVYKPLEGAEEIRHIERTTPLYNLRTGLYALAKLIDLSAGHTYDFVIFDRCIFDAYVWMMYWQEKHKLSPEEVKLYQDFFTSPFWRDRISLAYFMVCDPVEAMRREQRIAISSKLGETTNPANIQILADRYRRAHATLSPGLPQLRLLDTTKLKEQEMVEIVAMEILEVFERKIPTDGR